MIDQSLLYTLILFNALEQNIIKSVS